MAWTNIITQALFPMGIAFTPTVMAQTSDKKRTAVSQSEQEAATAATRLASILASKDATQSAESVARGIATSKGNEAVQDWLNHFGTSRVQLQLDEKSSLKGSHVDTLFALEDTPSALLFTQLGLHMNQDDGDLTVNLGLGKRHFLHDQMFGYNLFLDRDIQAHHNRSGLGLEYMRDNLRLSANSYLAMGGWKDSHHLAGYDEKAANGFDIRSEGYLPSLPQLGGKLMYEKYYGDNVGLFGKDKLQSNPSAVTVGVNYTPVPLVTLGVDRKQGNDNVGNTTFNIAFNYALGVPFAKQIHASDVAAKRSLAGSHYDLVERNNEIVLQYQEQSQLSVSLAPSLQGEAGQTFSLQVKTSSKNGVSRYEWNDSLLTTANGKITGSGDNWQVTLPSYSFNGNNTYPISLVVYDKAGNRSQEAHSQIIVTGYGVNGLNAVLQSSQDTLPADRQATTTVALTLNDANQQPISGMAESIQLLADFQPQDAAPMATRKGKQVEQTQTLGNLSEATEKPGTYLATLTAGSQPGIINITAKLNDTLLPNARAQVNLVANTANASIADNALKVTNTGDTLANGNASNPLTLPVSDANGTPLPDYDVTFTVTQPDGSKQNIVVKTDKDGVATLPITSNQAGETTVSTTVGGKTETVTVNFVADSSTATIADNALKVANIGNRLANGNASSRVTLPVTDAHGNPVPNYNVTFTVTQPDGSKQDILVKTDANGIATLPVTSTQAGVVTVSTAVGGKANTADISFVADKNAATIDDNALKAANTGTTVADGKTSNSVTLPISDPNGNPLPNYNVTFTVTQPDGSKQDILVKTDANGVATLPVTSTQAGEVTVSTTVGGKTSTADLSFVADSSTATLADNALKAANTGNTLANGSTSNSITLPVTDAHGNPLPNYDVTVTVTQPDGSQQDIVIRTDANGVATLSVTSTQAGDVTVSTSVGGKTETATVGFVADSSTATMADNAMQVSIGGNTAADGQASNSVTLPVTDANGNPLPDYDVTFTVTHPDGSKQDIVIKTDASGVATLPVTSTHAGEVTISTSVGGKTESTTVGFVADSSTATIADNAMQVVNGGDTVADGQASNSVTLPVTDANGNPLPYYDVTFTVTHPDGSKQDILVKTNATGLATLPVTSTQAGEVTVSTTVGGETETATLGFVADSSTATLISNTMQVANSGSTVADGKASNSVTLPITDTNGNPVPNYDVIFTVTDSKGKPQTFTVSTDNKGIATLPVSSTVAGNTTVSATLGGKTETADISFVANSNTATLIDNSMLVSNNGATLADGKATNNVLLTVTDSYSNPLAGYEVIFKVTNSEGKTQTFTVKTVQNGIATLPVTSTEAGKVTVSATVGGKTNTADLSFVADSSTATITDNAMQVVNGGGDTVADGKASNSVTLPVTDANGNPLPDYGVTFTVTQPDGSQQDILVKTDANGIATLLVTSTEAGKVTVSTTVGGKTNTAEISFVADSDTVTLADNAMQVLNGGDTVADGQASNSVTLPVTDANGNPVPNYDVTFTVTQPDGSQQEMVIKTDKDGIATLPVISTQAGDVTVATTVGGKIETAAVSFVADSSTATIADNALKVSNTGTTVADGTTTNTVTLPVTDAHGNPVLSYNVTFTVIQPDGSQQDIVIKTDANGIATLPVTSTQAGDVTVSTSVGGKTETTTVSFTADSSTATLADNAMQVVNGGGDTVADGKASNSVTLPVTDANGNPVPNFNVTFTVTQPDGSQQDIQVKTDTNGIATLPVTSTRAGEVTVTTTVGGKTETATVGFVADSNSATIADNALQVSNTGTTAANGTTANTLTLPVTDANGNPVPDYNVTFTVIRPDGSKQDIVIKTDANGVATLPVTSTQAGDATVSTTVGGKTNTADLSFVADSSTATLADNAMQVVNGGDTVADGQASNSITLPVADANGNPVPNYNVTFTVTQPDGSQQEIQVKTDKDGIAILPVTSTQAGDVTVATTVGGKTETATVSFVADSSTATIADNALKTSNTGTTVADGTTANTVTLPVTDAHGNPVPNYDVTFTVTQPDGSQQDIQVKTDKDGVATLPVTSTQAGEVSISTTVGGKTETAKAGFVADSSTATIADNALKASNTGTTLADGTTANTATLPVTDAHGNPVPNYYVTFTVIDTTGNKTITAVKTDENGVASLPVTSDKAGTVNVSVNVADKTDTLYLGFVADSNTATIADNALKTANTGTTVADGTTANTVTLPVTDAHGNPVPNYNVTFTVTQPDGSQQEMMIKTDKDGIATLPVTSTQAGDVTVSTTVGGKTETTTVSFTADSSTATLADNAFKVSNTGDTVADGQASNGVTLPVTDANGNPVPNYNVTFTVTQPDGSQQEIQVKTDKDGIATLPVTSTQAGDVTVSTTVGGKTETTTVSFTADSSTATLADNALKASNTGDTVADGNASNGVTLPVTDANGNPVPNYNVTFTVTQPDGSQQEFQVKTDKDGIATLPVTSTQAGDVTVATTVGGKTETTTVSFVGDSNTVTLADNAMQVVNGGGDTVADGQASNGVTLPVTDANGNPVPNYNVTFTVTQPDGSQQEIQVKTDKDGVATLPVTSTQAGDVTVSTTVGGKTETTTVSFTADSSTATIASNALTVVNNNAVANGTATNSVQVIVTDANNNPVPNQSVTFTADNGATIVSTATTDINGIAIATLKNTKAVTSTVKATTNGHSQSVATAFKADTTTATIASNALTVVNNNAVANGTATNSVQVIVTDANNNPVPNQSVTFTADNGATIVSTATTNVSGIATTTLKSNKRGTSTVTASTNGKSQSIATTFAAYVLTTSPNVLGSGNIPSGYDEVTFTLSDGNWLNLLTLPKGGVTGNKITIIQNATYTTYISSNNTSMASQLTAPKGNTYIFTFNGTVWEKQ
ncbi:MULTISPECIES: Ig-like domain-containing protein [unclassified Serratia (in: enterobacteria)]|uniref:Ig-like domain-containing protein n=1 Tax=unclassified Serratia (in: enterobacteria) TaxID=2647522 RepID=UPI0030765A17